MRERERKIKQQQTGADRSLIFKGVFQLVAAAAEVVVAFDVVVAEWGPRCTNTVPPLHCLVNINNTMKEIA